MEEKCIMYLVNVVQSVICNLIAIESRMVSTLPWDNYRERLNVLNSKFKNQRSWAEDMRIEIKENKTPKFRWFLASQQSAFQVVYSHISTFAIASSAAAVSTKTATEKFLVVAQPLP